MRVTTPRVEMDIVLTDANGKEYTVTVSVNLARIATELGRKAIDSQRKQASVLAGAVKVTYGG